MDGPKEEPAERGTRRADKTMPIHCTTAEPCQAPIDFLLPRLASVKETGKGWMALCPAHEDKNPSLKIDVSDAGAVLLKCWSGCSVESICESINLTLSDLFPNQPFKILSFKNPRKDVDARRETAGKTAKYIWTKSRPCDDAGHPYLVEKGIPPNGARLYRDSLVIPMMSDGEFCSLQFIQQNSVKRFLKGGRIRGCYYLIGDTETADSICVVEGFATGAAIRKATGYPVAVAFFADNLKPVALAMRESHLSRALIICADNDIKPDGRNPGVEAATAAAKAVGGCLAIPELGGRPCDWWDVWNELGAEAVEAMLLNASACKSNYIISDVADVSDVQGSNGAAFGATSQQNRDVSDVAKTQASEEVSEENPIPGIDKRPSFKVFDKWVEVSEGTKPKKIKPGVWYFDIDLKNKTLVEFWICSPLHVRGITYDLQENNFGRLLEFLTTLKRWKEWAMPMELLAADGVEMRRELLAMGLEIDPRRRAHTLLSEYIQGQHPKRRVRCALQTGWYEGSFVLSDAVIGPNAGGIIFQSGERGHDEYTIGGTFTEWRAQVAGLAIGNPNLTLAISASFAGPMLARCNSEGGGIHFNGDSSTGKTALIEGACSTWGGKNYKRSWRATANGMEGAASLFNDSLLALDEISECEPREVGAIVYALGNGRGKQRASRSGAARGVVRWCCFVLSSGEKSIKTTLAEGGRRSKAGQEVRLLDVPVSGNYGVWDDLHGASGGAAFSDNLKRAAVTHYGHAGRAFLEKLTADSRDFAEYLERIKSLPEFSSDGDEGQARRAAGRFAIVAMAGEVATEYGLTGWPEGAAILAAREGFKAWRAGRDDRGGNEEKRQILSQMADFIAKHGDSRFSSDSENVDMSVRDRAGWWSNKPPDGRVYLFNPAAMREALTGHDFRRALDVLQEARAIPEPDSSGERAKFYRISGRAMKLYPVQSERLEVENDAG